MEQQFSQEEEASEVARLIAEVGAKRKKRNKDRLCAERKKLLRELKELECHENWVDITRIVPHSSTGPDLCDVITGMEKKH